MKQAAMDVEALVADVFCPHTFCFHSVISIATTHELLVPHPPPLNDESGYGDARIQPSFLLATDKVQYDREDKNGGGSGRGKPGSDNLKQLRQRSLSFNA
jgi:hypothetical protein